MIQKSLAELKIAAKRGAAAPSVFCIEGEALNYEQIGRRLGISSDAARSRMVRLRAAPGSITWRALGAQQ
jgi:hypothetical protein